MRRKNRILVLVHLMWLTTTSTRTKEFFIPPRTTLSEPDFRGRYAGSCKLRARPRPELPLQSTSLGSTSEPRSSDLHKSQMQPNRTASRPHKPQYLSTSIMLVGTSCPQKLGRFLNNESCNNSLQTGYNDDKIMLNMVLLSSVFFLLSLHNW